MLRRALFLVLVPALFLHGMAVSHAQGGAFSLGDSPHDLCPHLHLGMVGLSPNTRNGPLASPDGHGPGCDQHAPKTPCPAGDHDEDAVYCSELTIPDGAPGPSHFFGENEFVSLLPVDVRFALASSGGPLVPSRSVTQRSFNQPCPIYLRTLSLRF